MMLFPFVAAGMILSAPVSLGPVEVPTLIEASGLVASRAHPGVLWTHNDGRDGRLFAVSTNAFPLGIWKINVRDIVDIEDIAVRATPEGEDVLLGDIGDNDKNRASARIYVVPAPSPNAPGHPLEGSPISPRETIEFTYENGPKNAESLTVDPLTGEVILITKEKKSSRVYRLDPKARPAVAREVARIPISKASGADISPDGLRLVVVNGKKGWMWTRKAGEDWKDVLARVPEALPYEPGPNGESIALSPDDRWTYTLSEGLNPVLYRGPIPKSEGDSPAP